MCHFICFEKTVAVNVDAKVWTCLNGKIMLTQQYYFFDLCLKSDKTRLLFDWQPCQRVKTDTVILKMQHSQNLKPKFFITLLLLWKTIFYIFWINVYTARYS